MKTRLAIVIVAVVLVTVSTLAVIKSSQHAWCAPMSTVRHHIKIDDCDIIEPFKSCSTAGAVSRPGGMSRGY